MSQYRIVFQNAEQIVYELDRRKPPAEDAEKKKKTQWKKKKKKKKKARIPNGPLVAAALIHEDTGTRHCVLDIYFAKKDYRNTERICRYLHVHLDAVFIRVHTRWRSPKRGKGNEYWRVGFRFPLSADKLRRVLHIKKGFPKINVCTGMSRMSEKEAAVLRRRYGNYASLFSFTAKPFQGHSWFESLSPCCNGCNKFTGRCTKMPRWDWRLSAGLRCP